MGALEKVPGVQNWVDRLPSGLKAAFHRSIIYRAAVHMHRERGMPVGMAIASAINWARHIAKTGDVKQWPGPQTVNPKSVAECVAALALWESMKAAARADTSIPDGERQTLDLTFQALDGAAGRIDLAWDESKYRRIAKGNTGGGRFTSKGGATSATSKPTSISVTQVNGKRKRGFRKKARDLLRSLAGIRHTNATREELKDRKEATGLNRLARRWNMMPPDERRRKMREFLASGQKLPEGWYFRADGSIGATSQDLSVSTAERERAASKGQTFRDRRFPVRNVEDLRNAVKAIGRAKESDRPAIRRYLIRRAKALGSSPKMTIMGMGCNHSRK